MTTDERPHQARPQKVLKVRVTTDMHDRLHVARLITGRPIATLVQEALAHYLKTHGPKPEPA